jgi:hypothetical protein
LDDFLMRLLKLQDDGGFSLVEFLGSSTDIPAYAILSHTWGTNNEEVTYQDLQQETGEKKKGTVKSPSAGNKPPRTG